MVSDPESNKLSLNSKKTELIIFRSKKKPINGDFSIKLNGFKLKPSDNVKYLGMYLDKHLSWDFHIHKLSNSLVTFESGEEGEGPDREHNVS